MLNEKSNQLLIFLLVLTFVAILGSNMVLKAEYDKIDRKDPFYGYFHVGTPPFKAVRLRGYYSELVQLQPGATFAVKVAHGLKDNIIWKVKADTLELSFRSESNPVLYQPGGAFNQPPIVYVIAPELLGVHLSGATAKLKGWRGGDWSLKLEGGKSGLLLTDNTINHLSASVGWGSLLKINGANRLGKTDITINNIGHFTAEKDVFAALSIQADTAARVELPGTLFRKLTGQ